MLMLNDMMKVGTVLILSEVIIMAQTLTEQEIQKVLEQAEKKPYYKTLVEKYRKKGYSDSKIAELLVELS
jgi:hypothetical protein